MRKTNPKGGGRPKLTNRIVILQLPLRINQLEELGWHDKAVKQIQKYLSTVTTIKSQEAK